MDAGVQIKAPVAGIAMGLIKESAKFAVLTDILGDEDTWVIWILKWLVPKTVLLLCKWISKSRYHKGDYGGCSRASQARPFTHSR